MLVIEYSLQLLACFSAVDCNLYFILCLLHYLEGDSCEKLEYDLHDAAATHLLADANSCSKLGSPVGTRSSAQPVTHRHCRPAGNSCGLMSAIGFSDRSSLVSERSSLMPEIKSTIYHYTGLSHVALLCKTSCGCCIQWVATAESMHMHSDKLCELMLQRHCMASGHAQMRACGNAALHRAPPGLLRHACAAYQQVWQSACDALA